MADNDDNKDSAKKSWVRDLTNLIIAVTGLLTALAALGFGCHNNNRIDKHASEIKANKKEIDNTVSTVNEVKDFVMPRATERSRATQRERQ